MYKYGTRYFRLKRIMQQAIYSLTSLKQKPPQQAEVSLSFILFICVYTHVSKPYLYPHSLHHLLQSVFPVLVILLLQVLLIQLLVRSICRQYKNHLGKKVYQMLDTVLRVAGIIVTTINTIVRIIELLSRRDQN